jgi:phosphogluconate dehydratase
MPELHQLTPALGVLLDLGYKVALVTDGRMSGASGKVPAAIHLSPEAVADGPIARIRDGDIIRLDTETSELTLKVADLAARRSERPDIGDHEAGCGRELVAGFRATVGGAERGAASFGWEGIV